MKDPMLFDVKLEKPRRAGKPKRDRSAELREKVRAVLEAFRPAVSEGKAGQRGNQ